MLWRQLEENFLTKLTLETGDGALRAYYAELLKYRKGESNILLILTSNMTDDTLLKQLKMTSRSFIDFNDGQTKDGANTLCMQFFSVKNSCNDDQSIMMS